MHQTGQIRVVPAIHTSAEHTVLKLRVALPLVQLQQQALLVMLQKETLPHQTKLPLQNQER
jgi:hypothetical protein